MWGSSLAVTMQMNLAPLNRRDTARQSRNRRQEGLTAEYAKYAEGKPEPGLLSAYSVFRGLSHSAEFVAACEQSYL
jgi:hypothetical protein